MCGHSRMVFSNFVYFVKNVFVKKNDDEPDEPNQPERPPRDDHSAKSGKSTKGKQRTEAPSSNAERSVKKKAAARQDPVEASSKSKSSKSSKSRKNRKKMKEVASAECSTKKVSKIKPRETSTHPSVRTDRTNNNDEDTTDGAESRRASTKSSKKRKEKRRSSPDSPVAMAQLRKFCLQTVEDGVAKLVRQFSEIKASTQICGPRTAFDKNLAKNRYKDVPCLDKSRVSLKWPPGNTSDYIHANWVDFLGEKKFVCTQGPTDATVDDFWRLVWQEKCRAIVMFCEVFEQNRKKCAPYWPTEVGQTMLSGPSKLQIRNIKVTKLEDVMTSTVLEVRYAEEKFVLKHLKWNNWPDRGVPEQDMAPFRLLSRIREFEPVLIHCSAGIGRTGTIVGLYMALQVLTSGEDLVLASVVRELRKSRYGSVQTDVQFVYMHQALLNLAESKQVLQADEMKNFVAEYDAFIKSRGG